MTELQDFTSNRSAKIRLTRAINKIQQQLDDEAELSDPDSV